MTVLRLIMLVSDYTLEIEDSNLQFVILNFQCSVRLLDYALEIKSFKL